EPALRAVVIAAGVAWANQPDRLAHAIAWLGDRAAAIGLLPEREVATLLALARLAELDRGGVDALLALLACDVPERDPVTERVMAILGCLRATARPIPPPAPLIRARARAWLDQLRAATP